MSGQMRLCGGGVVEGACVRGRMGVREVVWAADCGFLRSGNMSVGFRIGQSKTVVFFSCVPLYLMSLQPCGRSIFSMDFCLDDGTQF